VNRLAWHIGDNLRWLAANPGMPYVPCGYLTGHFLNSVADKLDALAAATGTAKTAEQAECEASQSGGEAVTPNLGMSGG
jgi:hypothetical protein